MSQALIQSKTVITQNTGTSKTMVMSQDAVTNSLSNKVSTALYTGTLTSSGWSSSAPYTQTLNVSGILSDDVPIVDVVLSSTTETAKSQLEAFGCLSKIETADGYITATCLDTKPTIDIPIKMKVIR